MQVRTLLHHAQPFDCRRRRDNPSHAQSGERHLREAIDVNHQIRTVQLLQRRHALLPRMQPRVNVVLHHRNLITSGQLEQFSARSQRHGNARGILKIGSQGNELHAVRRKRGLQRFQVQPQCRSGLGMRAHRHAQAARPRPVKDRHRPGISRVFHDDRIAGPHKRFADQIKRLLASIGYEQIIVLGGNSIMMQQLQKRCLQRRIAVRRAEIQDFRPFAAKHGIHAGLQFIDGEKRRCWAGHHE